MHPLKNSVEAIKNVVDCSELKDIVVTSITPVDKNSFTIRFVNYNDKLVDGGKLKTNKGTSYEWVNMNNRAIVSEEKINGHINLGKFKNGEIKTLKINI